MIKNKLRINIDNINILQNSTIIAKIFSLNINGSLLILDAIKGIESINSQSK